VQTSLKQQTSPLSSVQALEAAFALNLNLAAVLAAPGQHHHLMMMQIRKDVGAALGVSPDQVEVTILESGYAMSSRMFSSGTSIETCECHSQILI
jgi:hypothetical protein